MDSFTSYPEYLKSLKDRPVNKSRRLASRQLRVNKRDELRASKRTFSPMPPTPHKPASALKILDETTRTNTKINATGGKAKRVADAAMSTAEKAAGAEKPLEDRMKRLMKWREERDRKRAVEKASQKPVFKVSRHVEIPPVSVFNKPLASDNYTFRAPQNVRPIPTFQYGVNKKKETSTVKANKPETTTKKGQNLEKNQTHKGASQPLLNTRRKLNYQSEEDLQSSANKTKTTKANKVNVGVQVKRLTRQATTDDSSIKMRSSNKAVQVDVMESVPEPEVKSKRKVLTKQQHVDNKENIQMVGMNVSEELSPIGEVKPVKTPKGRKSRALSESGVANAKQNCGDEVDLKNVQAKEEISPIARVKPVKTPVKTPRGRRSRVLSECGAMHNQNGGEDVENVKQNGGDEVVQNVQLVEKQTNEEISPITQVKPVKTPVKTPKGRKSRALSESGAMHDQNGGEDVEEKPKKEIAFMSPAKTPKTPKTPRVKGRKSAGRTPARRLTKSELDLAAEDDADEARDKLTDVVPDAATTTPEELNSASTIFPCENLDSTFTIEVDDATRTPENQAPAAPVVYVSPFVTMSRGKRSARSEYKSRASKGGESLHSPEATGTKAGAAYFYKLLDDEIARIQGLCEQWEEYKLAENPPEEAVNMINVPIGQSKLLISKKMRQFRALVDKSVHSTDGLTVTCTDLHGFWETVMIQVRNLDKRYENLAKLRDNAWEEVLDKIAPDAPNPPPPPTKRVLPKRGAKKVAPPKPESKIRDAIRAARMKKKAAFLAPSGADNVEFNGGFYSIRSPAKSARRASAASPARTPRRDRSLLVSVLHNENRKSVKGSPGLAMMKATHSARLCSSAEGAPTPTKSILKMATPRSAVKKAVIFKEDEAEVLSFVPDSDEEDLGSNPLEDAQTGEEDRKVVKRTPKRADAGEPPRRSTRLSSRRRVST